MNTHRTKPQTLGDNGDTTRNATPVPVRRVCYCLAPASRWFGHRFYHQATIRNQLLGAGFTPAAADQGAQRAAEAISFEERW